MYISEKLLKINEFGVLLHCDEKSAKITFPFISLPNCYNLQPLTVCKILIL